MTFSKLPGHVAGFIKQFWPTLCVAGLIVYATLNNDPLPEMDMPAIPHLDKLIHAIMFGGLCGAWYFDLYRGGSRLTAGVRLAVAAACIAAGGADEVFQAAFTADRSSELLDWGADAVGVGVAYFTAPPAVRAVLRGKRR